MISVNNMDNDGDTSLDKARALLAARHRRTSFFPELAGLLDGPCWDLLLAIFIAAEEGELLAVTEATSITLAPRTTSLRHLGALEQLGHVVRQPDFTDRRRSHLRLTEKTAKSMQRYLDGVYLGQAKV
jgi:hypothetical protein